MASMQRDIQKIHRLIDRNTSGGMRPILRAYRDSQNRVQGEMARLTAEYIRDGTLSMSSQQRYQVLAQLDQQIVDQARQLGAVDLEHTTNILKESYQQSYYRTAYTLDRGLQQPVSFSLLRPEFVEASVNMPLAGERFSDRIWHNKEKLVARTRSLVQRSMIDGADPVKLARELKREFGTSAYESTRLVRNEVARCTRMAQDQIYSDSQVVSEVMFDATLDGLTSEICKDLDGERYPIDQKPEIPDDTHVGCRSDYIPVVDGWEPSQKFDNEEKQLIDYSSYPKWAESQGIT